MNTQSEKIDLLDHSCNLKHKQHLKKIAKKLQFANCKKIAKR